MTETEPSSYKQTARSITKMDAVAYQTPVTNRVIKQFLKYSFINKQQLGIYCMDKYLHVYILIQENNSKSWPLNKTLI